ncbi:MAG TPA: GAF domain-containing protein, partial [Terriglobales bacterium]|nr:GAF domain-containing protein [Terriglobales bacterium]
MSEAASEQRLHFLYQLNRGLTAFSDLQSLVQFAAQRTRELFRADGCAVIMLDRERNELYFPVVSDTDRSTEVKLGHLRFPADQGIAGWVMQHDLGAIVADTKTDPRFYRGIDQKTEMQTRALLCAPLRTTTGNIGVIELVNPSAELMGEGDLQFLETIAGDLAIACERTQLVENLRGEVTNLRQAFRAAGLAVAGLGAILLAGAIVR